MKFQIGDKVREGMHVGTVTDVGTVLIQVKTNEGTSRVVCPWELVRIKAPHKGSIPTSRQSETRSRRNRGTKRTRNHRSLGCAGVRTDAADAQPAD